MAKIQPLPRSFVSSYKRTLLKNQSLKYWHRRRNSKRVKRIFRSFLLISSFFVLIMVTAKRSQDIEDNEKKFAYCQRDLERKRIPAHIARTRKARMEARKRVKRNKAHQIRFNRK